MSRRDMLTACLSNTTFSTDPASTKYHGAYLGGLSEHSFNVMRNLLDLTVRLGLEWGDQESPEIIALAHDVCKIGAYLPDGKGGYIHNPDQPEGHGDLSVKRVKEWITLTKEEEACIRWHMGAFDTTENWKHYTEAIAVFPNVLWTHVADMLAALDEAKGGLG